MYYSLCKNVYLVKGIRRSCIYDFNTLRLYSLSNALANVIDLANNGKLDVDQEDENLCGVLKDFVKLGILHSTEVPISRSIEELKKELKTKFAWIEITNRCNLRCRHCYNKSEPHCQNVMSLSDFKLVIDSLLKIGVQRIQLIGGEPFFEKTLLKDMLDYVVGKFHFIEIFTNGTLITQDWVNYIAKNKIHVALSVYSYNEYDHDRVTTVAGSWEKTNITIKKLREKNVRYRVCNILMKNIATGTKQNDLYDLSKKQDIVRMSGRANFSLLTDDLIRKKLITKSTFSKPLRKSLCVAMISGHNCFKTKIYISANMEIYPCVMERRLKHGVINEQGITLDNSILNFNKDSIHECCNCEFRYTCFDCRPNSLSGDVFEKPWYCTYNPAEGKWEDSEAFIKKLRAKWGESF